MIITDEQFAYGFFDAEGTIVNHHSSLEVHVTQARQDILILFKEKYGGQIVIQREGVVADERQNGIRRKVWRWRLVGYSANQFIKDALPFLVVHRERALKAIEHWKQHLKNRTRKRMPNEYYKEAKMNNRKIRLSDMMKNEKLNELKIRNNWLEKRGWN